MTGKSITFWKTVLLFGFTMFTIPAEQESGHTDQSAGKAHQEATKPDTQLPIANLTTKIDSSVRAAMDQHNLPGAAVVVVQNGKTIYKQGFGLANIEQSIPVDPDKTLFRIGSISKALTLLTMARLIDQGRLSLEDDVSEYCEGIQNMYGFENPVTIENLLTHTSGFDQIGGSDRQIRNFEQPLQQRKDARPSISEYMKDNHLRRVSPAGQYYRYDTYGSTLAGVVLEHVTGQTYASAMKSEMFKVLGMNRTFVEVDPENFGFLATGYEPGSGQPAQNVAQPYEVYVTTPASSIDSTVADMGRLLEALTNQGANEFGRIFRPEMNQAVMAPQFRPHPEFMGTTHGLHESFASSGNDAKAVRTIDHGGTMQGFRSLVIGEDEYIPRGDDVFIRADGQNMVYFGRDKSGEISHFAYASSADTFERENPDRPHNVIQSLAQSVFATTREVGIDAAVKQFNQFKQSNRFYLREDEMNRVGYSLMEAGEFDQAIAIFQLNVDSFPDSWNAYDSLGEAYARAGNRPLAIDNYQKSLEINPENSAGRKALIELKREPDQRF